MTLPSLLCLPIDDFQSLGVMATTADESMLVTSQDDHNVQNFHQNSTQSTTQLAPSNLNNLNSNGNDVGESNSQANTFESSNLTVESVMPGIYFTKNFIAWNEDNLRSHGFTHIIIIDKHIQELYYPSPIFKLSTLNKNNYFYETTSPFDYFCNAPMPPVASLNFSKEFEAIDLNFGEKSYLTTVLPNCYRAVRFISKALQSGGTILIIDCNGGEQKCLTIIVAYLMYKYNISFSNAFARLKAFYKKADLDRFYISQLYEYEPILQVQRAQSRGHSCSRELHAAVLKRKKTIDDDLNFCDGTLSADNNDYFFKAATTQNKFFQSLNPLSKFNVTLDQNYQTPQTQQIQICTNAQQNNSKLKMTTATTTLSSTIATTTTNTAISMGANKDEFHCDDYAME